MRTRPPDFRIGDIVMDTCGRLYRVGCEPWWSVKYGQWFVGLWASEDGLGQGQFAGLLQHAYGPVRIPTQITVWS